jgi:hypothetical protein
MIPERVETLTSVTCGRNRVFQTPVGQFTFRNVPLAYYQVGIDLIETGDHGSFLMATREKALADRIRESDASAIANASDIESYLLEHLRVDPASLSQLDASRMAHIVYPSPTTRLQLLADFLKSRAGVPL